MATSRDEQFVNLLLTQLVGAVKMTVAISKSMTEEQIKEIEKNKRVPVGHCRKLMDTCVEHARIRDNDSPSARKNNADLVKGYELFIDSYYARNDSTRTTQTARALTLNITGERILQIIESINRKNANHSVNTNNLTKDIQQLMTIHTALSKANPITQRELIVDSCFYAYNIFCKYFPQAQKQYSPQEPKDYNPAALVRFGLAAVNTVSQEARRKAEDESRNITGTGSHRTEQQRQRR